MKYSGPVFFANRVLNGLRRRIVGERHVDLFFKLKGLSADKNIVFFPDRPHHPGYVMTKVCAELGLRPAPMGGGVAMLWQDTTTIDSAAYKGRHAINVRCTDISKRRMEAAFETVFDYPLAIDPTTYSGKAVCKSDENALHDGRVIDCPIASRDDSKVYEVLIDNSIDDNVVEDIRVAVVGNQLPLAYLKRRWRHQRFVNTNFSISIVTVDDVLSKDEQALVIKFAREIGLDFGELDTLRDRQTGKLYVVDAAKTAFGPPSRLGFIPKVRAVKRLAKAFKQEFLEV